MKKISLIFTVLFLALFVARPNITAQSKPITDIAPGTPDATSIFVDGLAILYYLGKTTEIGFVKDHHSDIVLEVFKKDGCREIFPFTIPTQDKILKINISKIQTQHGGRFYQDDVNPSNSDFRLMPDMCGKNWYQGLTLGAKPEILSKEHLSGKLVLKDVVFYTRATGKVNGAETSLIASGTQTNLTTGEKKVIPAMGRFLAADMIFETIETGLSIDLITDQRTFPTIQLLKGDGPYNIVVRSRAKHESDHLHLLYDYIIALPTGLPEYGLKYSARQPRWHPCRDPDRATEYVCQVFGGCGGTLPDFP